MNNIKEVDINTINLNDSYFHFIERSNLEEIDKEGLKVQGEDESGVHMSKGGKGILGTKNSFINEIKQFKICEIPETYRKYFDINNFENPEQVKPRQVYKAMGKKFKDEVCLLIEGEKISKVVTPNGDTSMDVVEYLYEKIMQHAKNTGMEAMTKSFLNDLSEMMEYIKQRENIKETENSAEETKNGEVALTVVNKEKWYEKVINFIRKIFSFNNKNKKTEESEN